MRVAQASQNNDDGEPVGSATRALWDAELPSPPESWPDATDFTITPDEARYLSDRVNFAAPDSLLAYLIYLRKLPDGTDFPWDHVSPADLPNVLGEELEHARNFSESMHGASLLYNLMLAQEKEYEDLMEEYEESLAEWWEGRKQRADALAKWNRPRFWALLAAWRARVPPPSHAFVATWLSALRTARRVESILSDRSLRE